MWSFIKISETVFQLTKWTLKHGKNDYFKYLRCSNGCNSKDRLIRVIICVFCTWSNISKRFLIYGVDMSARWKWIFSKFKGQLLPK